MPMPRYWPTRSQNTEGFALESGPVETNLVWVAVDPSLGDRGRGGGLSRVRAEFWSACSGLR